MLVAGSTTDLVPATTVVEIQDFNQGTATNPVLRTGPSLNHGRKFIPVILLNERIAVFGGSSQDEGNPVFIPEIFDPENEGQGWTDLTAAMIQYLDYIMVLHCCSLMDAFGQQAALLISVNLNCVRRSINQTTSRLLLLDQQFLEMLH